MNTESHADHGERISALEVGQRAIQQSLETFINASTEATQAVTAEIRATQGEIRALGGQIGKANWPTLISAGGFIFVLVFAGISPLWKALGESHAETDKIGTVLDAHQQLGIHPIADQRLKDLWLLQDKADELQNYKHKMIERRVDILEKSAQ